MEKWQGKSTKKRGRPSSLSHDGRFDLEERGPPRAAAQPRQRFGQGRERGRLVGLAPARRGGRAGGGGGRARS